MSRFRQQPRIGHLERLKKIVGYLANLPHGALRFRLHEPDYSNLPHKEYDWQRTVYGGAKEEIPHDIPEPKGKQVTTTTYVDANLHEYIAVYDDDLAICMKDPKPFCDTLKEKYKLKLKGVGPINYHLGCGYTRDEDGTLVADPRKYVEKLLESYENLLEKNQRRSRHL